MSCEKWSPMIDEYVEQGLDQKQLANVQAHIDFCPQCEHYYEDLKREHKRYLHYFMSIEATSSLWPRVQAGIHEIRTDSGSRRPLRQRLATAFGISRFRPAHAAVLLPLLITLGVVTGLIEYPFALSTSRPDIASGQSNQAELRSGPDAGTATMAEEESVKENPGHDGWLTKPTDAFALGIHTADRRGRLRQISHDRVVQRRGPSRRPAGLTTYQAIVMAERQYLNAIAVLVHDAKARQETLPADLISQVEKSLSDVERTIKATRQAVKERPGDAAAVQYMTDAYAQKLHLLRQIASN